MKKALLWEEKIRGGGMSSFVLKRHTALRLTDLEGGANVSALFFNADAPLERYNMPDTLKAQYTFFITAGRVLYSDMGRILCSVTSDSCGWHDTVCGVINSRVTEAKFGATSYQTLRNGFHRNGRDNFLIELAKHGLNKKDLHANVNFFSRVIADNAGNLSYVPHASRPGSQVELRAEMNVLVILSNTPHPLAPAGPWAPPPVDISVDAVPEPGIDDLCRNSRPENGRGFVNTEAWFR